MNQQLETMLRAYVHADQKDWSKWLDVLQLAYNNTPHSSHKEAPAKLLLGFKPRSPSDLLHESGLEFTEGLPELRRRLTELTSHREAARDALKRSLDKQAYYYDRGRRQPNLKEGDEVLINPHSLELVDIKGKSRKLVQRKIGPFEVMEVLSPTTYRLRLPDTYPMHPVVNIQHLTKYHRSPDKSRKVLENPRDQLKSSEEYEVEKIVAERRRGSKTFYLVRWKGYDAEDDSWQTARDLCNAPEIIRNWHRQLGRQSRVTALIVSRVTSTTSVFSTEIHHLVSATSRSIRTKMSTSATVTNSRYATYHREHASLGHRITFDYSLSSPAPTHEGRTSGFFEDSATRALLALNDEDLVMHSGSYGPKEPGAEPVDLSSLQDGSFDQRLLPFAPVHVSTFLPLILHELNGQPYPKKALVKALKEDIDRSLEEAADLGERIGLSLPFYVREILPKLLCEDPENSDPFAYQLRPYFSPSVLRVRWTRINRGKIMLHAFINLCHRILHPDAAWKVKPPVGIRTNSSAIEGTALSLARAYVFFGLPIVGLTPELPEHYSVESARDALLDPSWPKAPLVVELEHVIKLPEGSDDDPNFKELHPQYDTLVYHEDGVKRTAKERKLLHLYDDDGDVTLLPDLEPSQAMTPFFSRPAELAGEASTSAPSTSTSATPSAFSSASADSRNHSGSGSPGPERPTRSNARSRDYRGSFKQPKARNKGRSVYERLFESRRRYSPPSSAEPRAPYYSSERPPERAPRYEPAYRPPASSSSSQGRDVARPIESRLVSAQEEQRMVQDADTGNLVMVPIVRASFSQLGITRPQLNEYASMEDAAPDRHSYRPREDSWAREDRYPPTSSGTAPGQSSFRRPRGRQDRQESRSQPSTSRQRSRQENDAAATDPATGWGSNSAAGWGATDPW